MDKRVIELAKKIVKEGRDPASLRGLVEKELILKSQKPHRVEVVVKRGSWEDTGGAIMGFTIKGYIDFPKGLPDIWSGNGITYDRLTMMSISLSRYCDDGCERLPEDELDENAKLVLDRWKELVKVAKEHTSEEENEWNWTKAFEIVLPEIVEKAKNKEKEFIRADLTPEEYNEIEKTLNIFIEFDVNDVVTVPICAGVVIGVEDDTPFDWWNEYVKEYRLNEEIIANVESLYYEEIIQMKEERNRKIKQAILPETELAKPITRGRMKFTKIDEGNVEELIKFIIVNPKFLPEEKAKEVKVIIENTEEEIKQFIEEKAKEFITNKKKVREKTEQVLLKSLSEVIEKIKSKDEEAYKELNEEIHKDIEKFVQGEITFFELKTEIEAKANKLIEEIEKRIQEEKEKKRKEEELNKVLNNQEPVFTYKTSEKRVEIYLKDFEIKGNKAFIKLPSNIIGAFIGKGGIGVKSIVKLFRLKGINVRRIEVIKDTSVNVKRVERNRTIETIR